MTTNYDAPRQNDDELSDRPIEEMTARQNQHQAPEIDETDDVTAEGLDLPGADLSNEELSIRVLPKQDDEFTCMECFTVRHRSQLAEDAQGLICVDCAS